MLEPKRPWSGSPDRRPGTSAPARRCRASAENSGRRSCARRTRVRSRRRPGEAAALAAGSGRTGRRRSSPAAGPAAAAVSGDAAEQEIEQAFARPPRRGASASGPARASDGDEHHAAPHALKPQTLYATLTPPDEPKSAGRSRASARINLNATMVNEVVTCGGSGRPGNAGHLDSTARAERDNPGLREARSILQEFGWPCRASGTASRPAAKVSVAPSSRSTMVSTSATSPPASRTASTAFSAEPPVVVTSSTITMRLPLQALAFRQTLDREAGAVLLRLLAHEERRDRMALDPGQLRDRAGERHRAHLEPADIIEPVVLQRLDRSVRPAAPRLRDRAWSA